MPSICGSTRAQPRASVRRRDSRMPCAGVSRVSQHTSASDSTQPTPRLTSVVFLGSSSGTPPTDRCLADKVPIMVTSGIARAGANSLLPRRLALAAYSATLGLLCWPPATPPKPAISAMATAPTPTHSGGNWSPTRNTRAYRPQNKPLLTRLGLLRSVTVAMAVSASTAPTR